MSSIRATYKCGQCGYEQEVNNPGWADKEQVLDWIARLQSGQQVPIHQPDYLHRCSQYTAGFAKCYKLEYIP